MTATNNRTQRLEILDLARGFGFLVVLLQHCLSFLGPTVALRFVPQDATVLDFFFLMSGFFAGYAYEEKLRDGRKTIAQAVTERAVRMFPLLVLGSLLGVMSFLAWAPTRKDFLLLFTLAVKGSLLIPSDGRQLGASDLFPLDGPLWFLLYDWFAYLLFLFVLRHFSLKGLLAVAAVAVTGLWCAAISRNTVTFGPFWADCAWSVPRCLADFTIGYILFRCYRPNRFVIGPRFGVVPGLALLALVLLPVPAGWAYSGVLQAAIATFVMPVIIFFGAYIEANTVMARLAGVAKTIALPVYMLHAPVIRTLSLLRWDLHLRGVAEAVLLLAEFLFPIALAFLIGKYLEAPLHSFVSANFRSPSRGEGRPRLGGALF